MGWLAFAHKEAAGLRAAYRSADDVLRRNAAGYFGRRMIWQRGRGRTEVEQPAPGAGAEPRCRRRIVCAVAGPCFGRCVALQSLVRVGKWPVVIGILPCGIRG